MTEPSAEVIEAAREQFEEAYSEYRDTIRSSHGNLDERAAEVERRFALLVDAIEARAALNAAGPQGPKAYPGYPKVAGRCPACRGSSLFLGEGGHVTCARLECTNPLAADTALNAAGAAVERGPLPICICGHLFDAHDGHTVGLDEWPRTHCSQGDECRAYYPSAMGDEMPHASTGSTQREPNPESRPNGALPKGLDEAAARAYGQAQEEAWRNGGIGYSETSYTEGFKAGAAWREAQGPERAPKQSGWLRHDDEPPFEAGSLAAAQQADAEAKALLVRAGRNTDLWEVALEAYGRAIAARVRLEI